MGRSNGSISVGSDRIETKSLLSTWSGAHTAFLLTFLGHAFIHAGRKSFAASQSELEEMWGFSSEFLGALDTTFMISYGIGLLLNGYLAERLDAVWHMGLAVSASSLCLIMFGASAMLGISSESYLWYFGLVIMWALLQSSSIPCGVKIMSGWFINNRGTVFGIWATNGVFGNLLGLAITSLFATTTTSRTILYTLGTPSFMTLIIGLLQITVLEEGPYSFKETKQNVDPPSLTQTLMLPGVASYAATYACVKTVDTSMFFWIVFYLTEGIKMSESTATLLAMAYDSSQVFGSLVVGRLSDKLGSRPPVFFVALMAASLCSASITTVSSWPLLLPVIFSIGFTTGGPCMLMHTAVAADVASKGHSSATAAIVGIVDGSGSAAASVGQVVIGYVSERHGWSSVFLMLSALLGIAMILAMSIWIMETKRMSAESFEERLQSSKRKKANLSEDERGESPLLSGGNELDKEV